MEAPDIMPMIGGEGRERMSKQDFQSWATEKYWIERETQAALENRGEQAVKP